MGYDFIDGFGYAAAGYGDGTEKFMGRGIFTQPEHVKAAALFEWGGSCFESAYACPETMSAYGVRPEMESPRTFLGLSLPWLAVSGGRKPD